MALNFTVRSARCTAAFAVLLLFSGILRSAEEPKAKSIAATVRCADSGAQDQDDMCVWVHPAEPALSTIIASDKEADKLFVYGLDGKALPA